MLQRYNFCATYANVFAKTAYYYLGFFTKLLHKSLFFSIFAAFIEKSYFRL